MSIRIVAVVVALLAPVAARAQSVALGDDARAGLVSAGAFIGGELDTPDDWLTFGGDGRVNLGNVKLELNPRFSYHPIEDGSILQIDLNVLKNFELARPGKFRPFVGVGGALRKTSFDFEGDDSSDTDLGLNLISGVRLAMRQGAGYEPFLQGQYTILNDAVNAFSVVVGVSFSLR